MEKKVVENDYIDTNTGLRFVEDVRGNFHCVPHMDMNPIGDIIVNVPEIKVPPITIPEPKIHIDISPPVDDPEKQRLIRIMEALRSENNWLWSVVTTAIIDRKKSGGAPKALDDLEQKIKERQRA